MSRIKRLGILTGGGDCPGLNAVIRAVTKSSINNEIEVVGIAEGFGGLVNGLVRRLSENDVSGILPRGGTILGTSNRDDPFKFAVPQPDGSIEYKDLSEKAMENFDRIGMDALIVAGGDGSQTIALKLCDMGMPIVGIPKTIDNDLMATDITFGFDTALQTATEAVDKLHTTAESHHRVMVLEVMGRNSGWIALMSAIAGGGDVVLIPEIQFSFDSVAKSILARKEHGKRFSIVVVAEGARLPDGEQVSRTNPSGAKVLGGIGDLLTREIESRTNMETRVTVLGHLQRGGIPSPFDRILATRFGVKAVELVMAKEFRRMVCLHTPNISSVPLEEAVSQQRTVPPCGEIVRFARAVGMSFGDEYA